MNTTQADLMSTVAQSGSAPQKRSEATVAGSRPAASSGFQVMPESCVGSNPAGRSLTLFRVMLLETYDGPCTLAFANRDCLTLPAGRWWTALFGVVVDCVNGGCVTSDRAAWKLNPPPRFYHSETRA